MKLFAGARSGARGSAAGLEREDDGELARRAGGGDAAAVDEIYRRYADRLWREVLWPMLRDPARAEDALCETFLSALEALPRFQPREAAGDPAGQARTITPLHAWLRQIARRKALDALRGQVRATALEERVAGELETAAPAPDQHALLAEREEAATEAERVEEVLAALNPRYALCLRLRLQQGLSREACAEQLEVKLGTFDVTLHRAVKAFQKVYGERFGAPGATEDETT